MEFRGLSKNNQRVPTLSDSKMDVRCRRLAKGVEDELGLVAGQIAFYVQDVGADRYIALGGQASEFAERNKGKRHRVVECGKLGKEIYAWIGFQEQWRRVLGRRGMEFVRGSFTAHIGRQGEAEKPQVFRKEWVGRGSEQYREDIGQPHWQIDILESLRTSAQSARERLDRAFSDGQGRVVEFPSVGYTQNSNEVFARMPIERMHLASATRLWDIQWGTSRRRRRRSKNWIGGCYTACGTFGRKWHVVCSP